MTFKCSRKVFLAEKNRRSITLKKSFKNIELLQIFADFLLRIGNLQEADFVIYPQKLAQNKKMDSKIGDCSRNYNWKS